VARLFVAVWPPTSLLGQLRALERPSRPGLRWTTEDQWHVTLRFFGRVEGAAELAVRDALGRVAAATAPVKAGAGPGPRRLGPSVWVLPVEGLEGLAESIARATREVGQPPSDRRFRGHITVARARRPGALAGLPAAGVCDQWMAGEVTLVSSDLRPDGARYDVVGRWALGAGAGGARRAGG
jgi:RNA 2',3'-cyclic 3'-phosphodiesterase